MTTPQAKAFIDKMKSDATFSQSIMAIDNTDARLKAIMEAGFHCTKEDLEAAMNDLALDGVSGGVGACSGGVEIDGVNAGPNVCIGVAHCTIKSN